LSDTARGESDSSISCRHGAGSPERRGRCRKDRTHMSAILERPAEDYLRARKGGRR
jgi:hypothetical protein